MIRKSKWHILIVTILMCAFSLCMYGCGEKESDSDADDTQKTSGYQSTGDEYEDYIHEALEAVRDSAKVDTGMGDNSADEIIPDSDSGRVIQIERGDSSDTPESVFVSGSDAAIGMDNGSSTDNSSSSSSSSSSSTTEGPKVTPATFDVGTGLVYIDGKYDTAYATKLLTIINDARTGLNYPAMTTNTSLGTCANLRSKEITCFLSHFRPDGSYFTSLAPDYYKAEIITIDGATEQETFDAWMEDPISRGIIFSKEYSSIGAANYVCNGLNCIVVSFGY